LIHQPAQPVVPLLVSKADAARLLALSERSIDLFVASGELSKVRLGKRGGVRFKVSELERLVEDRTERAGNGDGQARDRQGRFRETTPRP